MKIVPLHPHPHPQPQSQSEKERETSTMIVSGSLFLIGIITTMIPVIDLFGSSSIWAKEGWNIARIMLDVCCFASGAVTSFVAMQKT